jgi:murein DD-endopeptidase MepM/ murein hydrolase activator NlpD
MRGRNIGRLLIIAAVLNCQALTAMEWPLPEAALVRNFGYNDRGRPILGIVFEGEGEVQAADRGELIFSRSGADKASRLPSPLGAWSAVDHGDGLISIYGRYQDEGRREQASAVSQGTPIATAGRSGWSGRDGVYFQLYDRRERRWVNASVVISPLPDNVPPQIMGLQLISANGRTVDSAQLRNISQGRYAITVNAVDTFVARGVQLAPHRIDCFVNGEEAGALSFETISARDGVLMANRNGLVPSRQVYGRSPAFEVGELHFNRGLAILEIIVRDVAGNSRSSITRMLVE